MEQITIKHLETGFVIINHLTGNILAGVSNIEDVVHWVGVWGGKSPAQTMSPADIIQQLKTERKVETKIEPKKRQIIGEDQVIRDDRLSNDQFYIYRYLRGQCDRSDVSIVCIGLKSLASFSDTPPTKIKENIGVLKLLKLIDYDRLLEKNQKVNFKIIKDD